MAKLYVKFSSRYRDENAYDIWVNGECSRVYRNDAGAFHATGRPVTVDEQNAVADFLAKQDAEFQAWKAEFDAKSATV